MKKLSIAILIGSTISYSAYAAQTTDITTAQSVSVTEFKENKNVFKIVLSSEEISLGDLSSLKTIYNLTGVLLKKDKILMGKYHVFYATSDSNPDVAMQLIKSTGLLKTVEISHRVYTPVKRNAGGDRDIGESPRGSFGASNVTSSDDPLYDTQVYMNQQESGSEGLSDLERAVALAEKNHPVRIGILDTGSLQHEDINVVEGYKFSTAINPNRGGSFKDETIVQDSTDPNVSYTCYDGHGSAVSSVIGSRINNQLGLAGIVDTDIVMGRVLEMDCDAWNRDGRPVNHSGYSFGEFDDLVEAMLWMSGESQTGVPDIQSKVDVINMSLGGKVESGCQSFVQEAINEVVEKGTIVVVSAGNSNQDILSYTPAGCDNVIVVGSNDLGGDKSSFSNYGSKVTVTAYGELLSTAYPITEDNPQRLTPDTYVVRDVFLGEGMSGTSFSAPLVSAFAALMKGKHGDIITQDVFKELISTTATPHGSSPSSVDKDCSNSRCGAGVLNAYSAMIKADMVYGFSKIPRNNFMDMNSCSDTNLLDAINYYLPVCDQFTLSIGNVNEMGDVYYEIYRDSSPYDWSTAELLHTTTIDPMDRSFALDDVDLSSYKYGVKFCDADKCYETSPVTFDESTLPNYCL